MRRAVLAAAPLMAGAAEEEPEEGYGVEGADAIDPTDGVVDNKKSRKNKKKRKGKGRHG